MMRPLAPAPTRRAFPPATVALLLALGLLAPGTALAGPAGPGRQTAVAANAGIPTAATRSDRILIRWEQNGSAAGSARPERLRAIGLAAGGNARFVRITGSGSAVYVLDRQLAGKANAVLAQLRQVPGVASVEPDLWMTADVQPNDTYAADLWALVDYSRSNRFGVDAPGAWSTTTGSGVVVAVIDTGILFDHPDLAGQTVAGYDMIGDAPTANDGDGRDPNAADPGDWLTTAESHQPPWNQWGCPATWSSWHGTHVAGTIAALANNSTGVFGGAPGVKIQPVRVLGRCGGWESDVADGITWASGGTVPGVPANPTPARILNLSLSGGSASCPAEYSSAIAGARSRGSVVVVAAGNANLNASGFTPANCTLAVTVAATNQVGKRSTQANSNWGSVVDIAAPGEGIKSTINNGTTGPNAAGYTYANYAGTSMASPHVALTAALIAAADSDLDPDMIEFALESTATPFGADASAGGCPVKGCGSGIVNAGRVIREMFPRVPTGPRPGS